MKYGYFDDMNREYVITTPKTPYPWINYLGCEEFFSLISNTAGGYCFYKDAKLRRITRYRYNNVPCDDGGRYFYIYDDGDFWSPGWKPVKKELEDYTCRHGLGYTIISGKRNNIKTEVLYFVPIGENCEIHKVKIKNDGSTTKNIKLFSFIEFCLWDALDDMTNFQRNLNTGEVEIVDNAIYHKTEYKERRNHFSFYSVNANISGFDTDRDSFIGMYNGFDSPQVVKNGKSSNSVAAGWSPIASHSIDITLSPGEEKEYIFVLGYIENLQEEKWDKDQKINKKKAMEMIDRYSDSTQIDDSIKILKNYWEDLLLKYQIESPDDKLCRMVNTWNQYQCMVTFNLSRSASYFESGIGRGIGFRDSNQDIIGFVHQIPEKARQRIIDLAAIQFEDGSCYHQFQPLTKKGNSEIGGNFNDDPLWLIFSTAAYIKETGRSDILNEKVAFENGSKDAILFDHVKKSFYHAVEKVGPHGLPLIGRADWNDCLNLNCYSNQPGESFQTTTNKDGNVAESILIAGLLVYIGNDFIKMCEIMGYQDEAEKAKMHIEKMRDNVLEHGFDGEWFLRAYDGNGDKIGSKENEEGKIFIESQGFCVMAGIGVEEGYADKTLDSVKKYLDTDHGIVILNPAFTKYYINMGEISTYPQGVKENAGIFCHNNPWIIAAETVLGRGEDAFAHYKKIAPAYREDISDLHKMEPYVYPQMIAGKDSVRHGEAKNSWLTGTAAWNFVVISQSILGIKPDYDGLTIDPCIPKDMNGYKIIRKFRGNTFKISVDNSAKVNKGIKEIKVNGMKIDGNCIKVDGIDKEYNVEVIMG